MRGVLVNTLKKRVINSRKDRMQHRKTKEGRVYVEKERKLRVKYRSNNERRCKTNKEKCEKKKRMKLVLPNQPPRLIPVVSIHLKSISNFIFGC
jgi:hypothetical protein